MRLMRRKGETTYTEEERKTLLDLLSAAPGVSRAEISGLHRKGGYLIGVDLDRKKMDEFLSVLDANDWMSVI